MADGAAAVRRTIAVDWSGAASPAEQRKRIWIAEARDGALLRLETGRTRDEVLDWLLAECTRTPRLAVGFDFAFAFPSWFTRAIGCDDARALWERAARDGERWLAEPESLPFWGRTRRRPAMLQDPARQFRRADRDVPAVGGIRPKSPFQVGGAGATGTGAIRGMPLLAALHDAGWRVWPFTDVAGDAPLAFELWPRLCTGAVVKRSAEARAAWLEAHAPAVPAAVRSTAEASEDAFDAAAAALAMGRHAASFDALPAVDDDRRLEGAIWHPPDAPRPAGRAPLHT